MAEKSPFTKLPVVKKGKTYETSHFHRYRITIVGTGPATWIAMWEVQNLNERQPHRKAFLHSVPEGTEWKYLGKFTQ